MSTVVQADLSALYPDVRMSDVEVVNVQVDAIEDALISAPGELVSSMDMRGQLQPITLTTGRRTPVYGVVDGRRRLAAARELGWKRIRAQILDLDPITEAATAISANAVRSTNPLSDVIAIQELVERGFSESEIAAATGLRVGTIRKRMKLLTLPKELWNGVYEGKIAVGIGERIASATPAVQAELVEVLAEKERVTGADVSNANAAVRTEAAQELADLIPKPQERNRQQDFSDELHELVARYAGVFSYDDLMTEAANAWESVRGEVEDDR